jgi:Protein-L-isoaspartate carboxylmethyltransferase
MSTSTSRANHSDGFEIPRKRMVERLRDHYKIMSERVLDVMNRVPRHLFVPEALRAQAYKDNALPISSGQTISQPFIVAKMSELLELAGREKVLEIGAGSGYQTAVLASLARTVFAIERLPNLADAAKTRLKKLGFLNVSLKCDDGTSGWPMYSPFDAILGRRRESSNPGTADRTAKSRRTARHTDRQRQEDTGFDKGRSNRSRIFDREFWAMRICAVDRRTWMGTY